MLLCVHWIFFFLVVTRKKKIQWTREIREKVHDYLQNSHISDVWQNYFAIIVAKKTCTLMILSRLNNAWQLNMTWYDISSDIAAMMQLPALESNRPILEWCWLRLSHAFLSLYNSRTPPRKHAQHRFIGASSTDWSLWCWCVSHFFTLSHLAYHNNLTLHRVFSFTSLVKNCTVTKSNVKDYSNGPCYVSHFDIMTCWSLVAELYLIQQTKSECLFF